MSVATLPAEPRAGGLAGIVWLTWRQHRWALISALVLTAVFAGWMAHATADMLSIHHLCHDTSCPPFSPEDARLMATLGPVRQAETSQLVVRYLPLMIGVFLGVPLLAREHEQRTLLLAWSQDLSPARWLWTKLALLGLYVAALSAVLAVVAGRMTRVYSAAIGGDGLFDDRSFLVTGMLPLAAGVCWFAVGVALGAVIRRTLPAVFATLAAFIGLLMVVLWRYPTLMAPKTMYHGLGQPGPHTFDPNALILKGDPDLQPDSVTNLFQAPGHALTYADLERLCPNITTDINPFGCLNGQHLLTLATYQPSSRIPVFHLIVAGGYLGVTALALTTVWLVVRRTSLTAG